METKAMADNGENMIRKQLLALPCRAWNDVKDCFCIIVVPTGKKHGSGWMLMAIIGCNENCEPYEIAAYFDDIQWETQQTKYGFRTDMFYKNGCIRFHSREFKYQVGASLSTTEIKMVKK